MVDAEKFVNDQIKTHKVVIFSKSYCPFCIKAKKVFDQLNERYEAVELDKRPDGDEIQAALLKLTKVKTVPRVFVNGQCIGGGDDVQRMYQSQELQKLL